MQEHQLEQSETVHELHARLSNEYAEQGYVVVENVLDRHQLARVRGELEPLLEQNVRGRNNFEGFHSNRIYAMLAKSDAAAELVQHPLALGFAEAELGRSCLLSACLAINLLPGESVQPWHTDTGHMEIPRPRDAYGVSVFWALDDTTATNGATEVIPGSHLWAEETPDGAISIDDFQPEEDPATQTENEAENALNIQKVLLPAGAVMIAQGTLWHRGGANQSESSRLIVTTQYCPGWARQLENMMAAISPQRAAELPPRVRELIGYSIHPPFMGYTDGMHPERKLAEL